MYLKENMFISNSKNAASSKRDKTLLEACFSIFLSVCMDNAISLGNKENIFSCFKVI